MKAEYAEKVGWLDSLDEDERDIVIYGLSQLPLYIGIYASLILIALLFNMLWQCALYAAVYFSIRKYAGGVHASTRLRCYCCSVAMVVMSLIFINYVTINAVICKVSILMLGTVFILAGPVESVNKPLDDIEQTVFGRRLIITIAIWVITSMFIHNEMALKAIYIAMLQLVCLCVIGIVELKIRGKIRVD